MTDNKILTDIVDRLGALEAVVLGHKADTRGVNVNLSDRRLTKREVAIREGKSERTIDRERKDPKSDFPKPDIINGRCFWWLSKLQAYDRKRARRAPTGPIRQRNDRGRFTKGHDAGEDMI
jgi:predicted DNA-binding transcriptional regulator AlpA